MRLIKMLMLILIMSIYPVAESSKNNDRGEVIARTIKLRPTERAVIDHEKSTIIIFTTSKRITLGTKNIRRYTERGVTYNVLTPTEARGFKEQGKATWYSYNKPRITSSEERFNPHELTAAHKTLPFGTRVKVTNLQNHKTVIVRITDRGPFGAGRIIDLTPAAFKKLAPLKLGVLKVKIEVL